MGLLTEDATLFRHVPTGVIALLLVQSCLESTWCLLTSRGGDHVLLQEAGSCHPWHVLSGGTVSRISEALIVWTRVYLLLYV